MLLEPQALLSGVKNGNRLMFTLCYDRYHRGIYLFVLKYVRCEALAEDIVQEVFFRLWCNRRGLREEGNLAALLYAMAKNLTVNAIHKHKIVETGNVRYYDLGGRSRRARAIPTKRCGGFGWPWGSCRRGSGRSST